MKISVVLPCLNGMPYLRTQLEALARQRWIPGWELVFVDNGSTDGSAELARGYASRIPEVRVVDASARTGQPFALNVGIRAARGDAVVFTDADDEVDDGWLEAMGRALEEHEIVACRTDGVRHNAPAFRRTSQETGLQKLWYPPFTEHAGGGTLGAHGFVFERIGDFDEDLPYLHDTDLCIRARLAGLKIHFVPDAVLHVRNRSTAAGLYRQSRNWAEYNAILARKYWQPDARSSTYWKTFLRDWLRMGHLVRNLRRTDASKWFARQLGRQIGRIKGVLMHRGVPV